MSDTQSLSLLVKHYKPSNHCVNGTPDAQGNDTPEHAPQLRISMPHVDPHAPK